MLETTLISSPPRFPFYGLRKKNQQIWENSGNSRCVIQIKRIKGKKLNLSKLAAKIKMKYLVNIIIYSVFPPLSPDAFHKISMWSSGRSCPDFLLLPPSDWLQISPTWLGTNSHSILVKTEWIPSGGEVQKWNACISSCLLTKRKCEKELSLKKMY